MPAGQRRGGNPRTEAERRARHKRLYGNENVPPRGTGLKKGQKGSASETISDKLVNQEYS